MTRYIPSSELSSVHKDVYIRVAVGITCSLSLLGALLIILSYVGFKDLRTTVRMILVHLSIMDLGSALGHLVGVTVYFDQYYIHLNNNGSLAYFHTASSAVRNMCKAQAFLSVYFNLGAFMWTASLAIYLYFRISHFSLQQCRLLFYIIGILSYLIPVPLTLWLLLENHIGYTPYGGAGWCGLKIINPYTRQKNVFVTIFGYDLIQYTTLILAGVLFIATYLRIRQEYERSRAFISSDRFWGAYQKMDYKLIIIPVVFIVLRLPSCFLTLCYIYTNISVGFTPVFARVIEYAEGIGDSSQGIANALLFILFTTKVRKRLNPCYWLRDKQPRSSSAAPTDHAPLLTGRINASSGHTDNVIKNLSSCSSSDQ